MRCNLKTFSHTRPGDFWHGVVRPVGVILATGSPDGISPRRGICAQIGNFDSRDPDQRKICSTSWQPLGAIVYFVHTGSLGAWRVLYYV